MAHDIVSKATLSLAVSVLFRLPVVVDIQVYTHPESACSAYV